MSYRLSHIFRVFLILVTLAAATFERAETSSSTGKHALSTSDGPHNYSSATDSHGFSTITTKSKTDESIDEILSESALDPRMVDEPVMANTFPATHSLTLTQSRNKMYFQSGPSQKKDMDNNHEPQGVRCVGGAGFTSFYQGFTSSFSENLVSGQSVGTFLQSDVTDCSLPMASQGAEPTTSLIGGSSAASTDGTSLTGGPPKVVSANTDSWFSVEFIYTTMTTTLTSVPTRTSSKPQSQPRHPPTNHHMA